MRTLLFFLLLIPFVSMGQNDFDMDELARNAPSSGTLTVEQLARYFVKNIPDDRGRVRAIFAWITLNIKYLDTSNQSEIWATPEHIDRQRPEQVLINRTAVCQGFANLFQALAKQAGMECQVVTGIVKNQEGAVMRVGHAWVAAEVQGQWRLFDPTWSKSEDGWHVNDQYFMASPKRFVLSHLPDDPAWQLLENPITETDFRENETADIVRLLQEKTDPVFNFQDTLQQWIALDSVARTFSSESRVLQFNGSNERVVFSLGQSYWGLFFDLRAHLDSLADRSILQDSVWIDTAYFFAQLDLMQKYHTRARTLFSQLTEPKRVAQTEKFYTPADVAAITNKLRAALWSAVSENQYRQRAGQINEASLLELNNLSDTGDRAYQLALQDIDCRKLENTCYEIWHNLSLVHLQLAERYALFSQNLLAEKGASKYLVNLETAINNAQKLYEKAEAETRQLLLIPPPYAFVRNRLKIIQQGLFTIKLNRIRVRRVALTSQIEAALAPSNRTPNAARPVAGKLQAVADDMAELSQMIEDACGELGSEYCDVTLFNLNQEIYAIQFNLSSLHFRTALDMYQSAVEKNTLPDEKKRIEIQAQKAIPWLREARQSLDFLEKSKRVTHSFVSQRALQINKLSNSIQEFLDSL